MIVNSFGRSAPRRLSGSEGSQAFLGAGGEVFFASQEKGGTFIYRVKEDGSGLKKVIPEPVYFLYGVSPDGKHVAAWVNGSTEETANAVVVYPVDGASPTMICGTCGERDSEFPQFISWSPDGKLLYIAIWGVATYAVPLRPGQILPALPPTGIRSFEDAAGLPGAKPFPVAGVFAGPNPSIYAHSKVSAQPGQQVLGGSAVIGDLLQMGGLRNNKVTLIIDSRVRRSECSPQRGL